MGTLPTNWPPQPASGNRSIRFFATGTATTDYTDNAFIFSDDTGANTYTTIPIIAPGSTEPVNIGSTPGSTSITQICADTIQVTNDGTDKDLYITFDGTNIQGIAKKGETICWRDRREAGLAVYTPSGTADFRIEAW